MLSVTFAKAVLPALSTAVPVMTWPTPSVITVIDAAQVAMPLVASEQAKLTVALVLFQLAAFGAGVTVAWIIGGAISLMTLGVMVVDPPAFVPTMVSVCVPSGPRSKPESDQEPLAMLAGWPLTLLELAWPALPVSVTRRESTIDPVACRTSE